MERTPLDSTNVKSAGYDAQARVLEIEFAGGRVYRYREVPVGVFTWLVRTRDKGAYVARMIADRFEYEEITATDGGSRAGDMSLADALRASLARDPHRDDSRPPDE